MPWIIRGDFNTILSTKEKRGGLDPDLGSMADFQDCIIDVGLSEIEFEGNKFTWCNNQRGRRRIGNGLIASFVMGRLKSDFLT